MIFSAGRILKRKDRRTGKIQNFKLFQSERSWYQVKGNFSLIQNLILILVHFHSDGVYQTKMSQIWKISNLFHQNVLGIKFKEIF